MTRLDNPKYLADLRDNSLSNKAIAHRWGCGKTTVQEDRKRIGFTRTIAPAVRDIDPSIARGSKSSELNEDSSGNLVGGVRSPERLTKADIENWLSNLGYRAEDYNIAVGFSEFVSSSGDRSIWNKVTAVPKKAKGVELVGDDAEVLLSIIPNVKPGRPLTTNGGEMVVALADFQTGKVSKGLGTAALVERFESILSQIILHIKETRPKRVVIADLGDCIENITSSAPNQIATNDLSVPDQLRLWQRILLTTIISIYPLTRHVTVTGAPSNHAETRNADGKVGYGDYGIGILGQVKDALEMTGVYTGIEWIFPENEWDIASFVEIGGTVNAFFHGHHAKRIENMPQWVANQAAGRSPIADATICVHGHFHHRRYTWSRGREIISCPAMEGASDWFENATGEFSIPGMITYFVRDGLTDDLRFWRA